MQTLSHIHRIGSDLVEIRNWKVITNPFNTPQSRRHAVIGFVDGKSKFLDIQEVTGLKAFKSNDVEYVLVGQPDQRTTGQLQDSCTPLADAWFSIELRKETHAMFGDEPVQQLHLAAVG